MHLDALAIHPDALAIHPDALAMHPDALAMYPDALAMMPDAFAMLPNAFAIMPDAFAIASDAFAMLYYGSVGSVKISVLLLSYDFSLSQNRCGLLLHHCYFFFFPRFVFVWNLFGKD